MTLGWDPKVGQTSKIESYCEKRYEKILYSGWKPIVFCDFREREEVQKLINLLKMISYKRDLQNWLVHTFSGKSDEILTPVDLNLVFRYKIFKYKLEILIQHLKIR